MGDDCGELAKFGPAQAVAPSAPARIAGRESRRASRGLVRERGLEPLKTVFSMFWSSLIIAFLCGS
jgi:hypothetical protein